MIRSRRSPKGSWGPRVALGLDPSRTIAGLYDENVGALIVDLVMEIGRPNLVLVAGHDWMTNFNVPRPWTTGGDQFIKSGL